MRFMTRGLMGLFLFVLSAALILAAVTVLMSAFKGKDETGRLDDAKERIFTVNTTTVEPMRATPVIESFGEVISGRTLELRVRSDGALVQISKNFREGGQVSKGELLFQTDPATASANAQLSEAELEDAKAELQEANEALSLANDELRASERQFELRQQALKRQESLRERGVGTEAAIETAALSASSAEQASLSKRQELANAKARISRAKIALSRSQINHNETRRRLLDTSVYAEFDGVLSEVSGVLGGLVNVNERLANLIDPKALEVSFRISNAEFNRIIGQNQPLSSNKVFVAFTRSGAKMQTFVDRVGAAVGEGQTGRELFAPLDLSSLSLVRTGDFVFITLEEPALENVSVLPATAVSSTGEVLLLGENNRLEAVKVDILRKQADNVIISIGELTGRKVVLERAPQLGSGIKVEPRQQVEG